ncbi:chemotaxis protein CheA [Microvirga subterranea]|uniref:Chemotaxis protein CheA n=1 Tax=Microvirga subterranea TaxID=186651 RepID=A0A370HHN3_9HYPH|nr:chemotaxis protein CheA [Microvirga subterranea]RDI57341.1 two-component system chemotaxis sensor kinase CheA [Microvirga subterranea]
MDDLLQHFIVEARDLVQRATDDLMALEKDPAAAGHLDGAFRAVHTLKGSVGLFDFAPMGLALHAAEDLLGAVKAGQARAESQMIDTLLDCIDQVERWVDVIERDGQLPAGAASEGYRLAQALRSLLDREGPARSETAASDGEPGWVEALIDANAALVATKPKDAPLVALRYTPRSDCFFAGDDPIALLRAVPDLVAVRLTERDPWPPAGEIDPFSCNLTIEALSGAGLDEVKAPFRFLPDQVTFHEIARAGWADASETTADNQADVISAGARGQRMLRVDPARVDRLADLVGELIIAKNALTHLAGEGGEGSGRKGASRGVQAGQAAIDRLVAEMHSAVMDIRMMPMRDVFRRFPRAVRETAGQLHKAVDFSMEGEDVEADKSVVEGLFEPLLHVLRNAVAHGAEPEVVRRGAGKPVRTQVVLRARREGDRVMVEVEDDGGGIDPAAIRRVARERHVASDERIGRMSDDEAVELIFAPGFSTASEITDLAGRGVGMDAVRSAIERLGGQIGVQSVPGRGTTIRLSLPLTIVMTKVMAVRVGGERYGIPLEAVVETASVPKSRILPVQDAEAFVLRDRTFPLLRLGDLLELPRTEAPDAGVKTLVMSVGGERVGIAVDGFSDTMDVLMRPMDGILAGMPGVMGTTLLGDGSVLMILDIPELIG